MSNPHMKIVGLAVAWLFVLLSGCSGVSTQMVELNPAQRFPPTQNVEVLLEKPQRPYIELGLLESRGDFGATEATLLNDAREKARSLGADAILKLEIERLYHPPVTVYDPWYDPLYWSYYRYRRFSPFPDPWGPYRVVGGGYEYTLKALAIKYKEVAAK
jgi:hypothetical protein